MHKNELKAHFIKTKCLIGETHKIRYSFKSINKPLITGILFSKNPTISNTTIVHTITLTKDITSSFNFLVVFKVRKHVIWDYLKRI